METPETVGEVEVQPGTGRQGEGGGIIRSPGESQSWKEPGLVQGGVLEPLPGCQEGTGSGQDPRQGRRGGYLDGGGVWAEVGRSRCCPCQKRVCAVTGPQRRTPQQGISDVLKKPHFYSVLSCF